MNFKRNILFVLIIPVLIAQCSILEIKNTFYSDDESLLLDKTLSALEYGYGYDYEVEMNYIYSYSYSKDNADKKEKAFAEIVNNADFKTTIGLYEKIIKLQAVRDYKMEKFTSDRKWNYYNFIKNDLSEALDNYSSLLSKYILKKNESLDGFFDMKKQSIRKEVFLKYSKKDMIVDTF